VPFAKQAGNLPAVELAAPQMAVATQTAGDQQHKALPETTKYYDTWGDFALVAEREAAQASHARTVFLDAVTATFRGRSYSELRLLDGGCGTGRDVDAFKRLGYVCEGFDPCQGFVQQARARSGCTVHVADFESFNVPARFHGVFSLASLYHVPRARLVAALQNLRRHLEPGGVLLVTMPLGQKDHLHPEGCWVTNMTPDDFASCISAAGFSNPQVHNDFAMYGYKSTMIVAWNGHIQSSDARLADGNTSVVSSSMPVVANGLHTNVLTSSTATSYGAQFASAPMANVYPTNGEALTVSSSRPVVANGLNTNTLTNTATSYASQGVITPRPHVYVAGGNTFMASSSSPVVANGLNSYVLASTPKA